MRSTDGETAVTTDYLQLLKDQVARYMGTLREVVILAPIYAVLMFHLQDDPRLEPQHRLWVEAAIGYIVSPHDVPVGQYYAGGGDQTPGPAAGTSENFHGGQQRPLQPGGVLRQIPRAPQV